MIKIVHIAIGGALGALLRYWISGVTHRFFSSSFPWGTLSVNLMGCLLIGLLWGVFESLVLSQNIRLFIFIGFLGSFTTFSTFSLENFHLFRDGEYLLFFGNIMISLFFGIMLVYAGFFMARYIVAFLR